MKRTADEWLDVAGIYRILYLCVYMYTHSHYIASIYVFFGVRHEEYAELRSFRSSACPPPPGLMHMPNLFEYKAASDFSGNDASRSIALPYNSSALGMSFCAKAPGLMEIQQDILAFVYNLSIVYQQNP